MFDEYLEKSEPGDSRLDYAAIQCKAATNINPKHPVLVSRINLYH